MDTAEAEGIFISCTNLRSAEAVDKIERDFGKPTTCSNVATLWYTLRKLGCSDEIGGAGMLLRDPALRPQ